MSLTVAHHGVPVGNRKAEMFSHRLGADTLIFVVIFECKGILGILPLIGNLLLDFREIFIAHGHLKSLLEFCTAGGLALTEGVLGKSSHLHKRFFRYFISSNRIEPIQCYE